MSRLAMADLDGLIERGSAWDRIFADPKLVRARQKLSADEIMTIIRHVWAADEQLSGEPYRININGTPTEWAEPMITHEDICRLAGEPPHASVTWSYEQRGRRLSGITSTAVTVPVFNGMNIDCVVTGDA